MFFFLKKTYIKRLLKSNALRKGLLGGSPFWRVVWGAQLLLKGWNKISKDADDAPIEFNEPLQEGQVWAVVHEPEQSRKGRGEGRKMLIGPQRAAPRANAMTGTALATVGKKILEAPSAERINSILGVDAVTDPPPSRSQKRMAKKTAKRAAKATKVEAKQAAKDAKSNAKLATKTAKTDAKLSAKTAKTDAKLSAKTAKTDAKQAVKTAKADADAAAKQAKVDAKAASAAASQKVKDDRARARAEQKAAAKAQTKRAKKAVAKQEAKAAKEQAKADRAAQKADKAVEVIE